MRVVLSSCTEGEVLKRRPRGQRGGHCVFSTRPLPRILCIQGKPPGSGGRAQVESAGDARPMASIRFALAAGLFYCNTLVRLFAFAVSLLPSCPNTPRVPLLRLVKLAWIQAAHLPSTVLSFQDFSIFP